MSNSVLTINGQELQVPAEIANHIYRLIHEIVCAGKSESLVIDTESNGQPSKLVILVNPATQVSLATNDVAAMSIPFYDANIALLTEHYLRPYVEDEPSES